MHCTETFRGVIRGYLRMPDTLNEFSVATAHSDASVLKRRPPVEGGMPKRLETWIKVEEIAWSFHGAILPLRVPISRGIHSPRLPPVLCAGAERPHVWGKRLLGSVMLQKGGDRMRLWHVNTIYRYQWPGWQSWRSSSNVRCGVK